MMRAITLLAILAGCAPEVRAPTTPARPALWKVSDIDTTIYLFGTIHVLPRGLEWGSPALNAEMRASRRLVLEVVLDKDPAKLGAAMRTLAVSPGLPPILDRVPLAKRAALAQTIAAANLTTPSLDGLETWAAALAIASGSVAKLGGAYDEGAEARLTETFERAAKPVVGLETVDQQLGYFDRLPEAAQRAFLASVADNDSDLAAEYANMVAAWRSGDVRRIAVSFDEEVKLTPVLADALIRQRNANWARWVEARMARPGTEFVAVGAGHLAGTDAVTALLERRGMKVERVQ